MKLPSLKLPKIDLPRPARWDWIAIGVLLLGALLAAANLYKGLSKPPGEPYPSGLTTFFVFSQLAVACVGLMLLGKTAKEGTGWGNAASLLAMFIGISGVLLAAALWAAA
jgi:preprotein translocase subunit SecY